MGSVIMRIKKKDSTRIEGTAQGYKMNLLLDIYGGVKLRPKPNLLFASLQESSGTHYQLLLLAMKAKSPNDKITNKYKKCRGN